MLGLASEGGEPSTTEQTEIGRIPRLIAPADAGNTGPLTRASLKVI